MSKGLGESQRSIHQELAERSTVVRMQEPSRDVRADPSKACMLTQGNAHASDVNVIDWNPNDPFIVSGGDDGLVKIWDLRNFGSTNEAVATFHHHTAPVTCVRYIIYIYIHLNILHILYMLYILY